MMEIEEVAELFWQRVAVGGPDECWPWLLSRQRKGYATWGIPRGSRLANHRRVFFLVHRFAWLVTRGPIPPGWTVDHRCRLRWCCNPAHLQLRTHSENCADNAHARRTHCPNGHPYDGDNLIVGPQSRGFGLGRWCRECKRASGRRAAAKRKGAA